MQDWEAGRTFQTCSQWRTTTQGSFFPTLYFKSVRIPGSYKIYSELQRVSARKLAITLTHKPKPKPGSRLVHRLWDGGTSLLFVSRLAVFCERSINYALKLSITQRTFQTYKRLNDYEDKSLRKRSLKCRKWWSLAQKNNERLTGNSL